MYNDFIIIVFLVNFIGIIIVIFKDDGDGYFLFMEYGFFIFRDY